MLDQALSAATAIPDDANSVRAGALTGGADRAQVLTALAPHLPPYLLAQALEATPKTSIEALTALLQRSRSVLPRDEDAAYVNLLRREHQRNSIEEFASTFLHQSHRLLQRSGARAPSSNAFMR